MSTPTKIESLSGPASRLFAVLELTADLGMVSVSDLVNLLELPRPTAHRLLSQLEEIGLLQKLPYPSKYAASPKLICLASGLMRSTFIRAPIRALLVGLARTTGETHHVAVFSRGEVEFFEVFESEELPLTFPAGKRFPPHSCAAGQYFLSQLPEKQLNSYLATGPWQPFTKWTITEPSELMRRIEDVRKKDYAIQSSEFVEGIIGLAVPIRNKKMQVSAVLIARTSDRERTPEQVENLVPIMRRYAAKAREFF
jgi:IclR family transcriptional regulator, acetate operon repressor